MIRARSDVQPVAKLSAISDGELGAAGELDDVREELDLYAA